MNTLKRVRHRLLTYYCYLIDLIKELEDDFPTLVSATKQAKTGEEIAFAMGELAAYYVFMEKFVVYAHHFGIPMDALGLARREFTEFERFYNRILNNPKLLKEESYVYRSYLRELVSQFKEAHTRVSLEEYGAKTKLYRAFSAGQVLSYYVVRKRLRDQAESFLIPLKEIDMEDPIPVSCLLLPQESQVPHKKFENFINTSAATNIRG
jgi:hypothetical protein